jgi:acetylornithine deacetylase/succinyl-diaminopimelate desuccinylase-like protein
VLADAGEWQVDPWSGELRDGEVWGRGALDMKGQVAASAVAIASLAREGFQPRGDLVFAATADEEVGDDFGLSWLCREHPEAVRTDYAINEGGGERIEVAGRGFYLCSTAEKMSAPFALRVHGRSGHASMPGIADNALVKAAGFIPRLGALRPPPRLGPEVEALLEATLGEVPPATEATDRARALSPLLADTIEPLFGLTVSPTLIEASKKRNVIPATCVVTCDCRLLPGQTQEEAEALIRETLGPGEYELEWIEAQGGTRSPLQTPLWEAVESFVEQVEPGARTVPICVAGFTDSHWVREAFGTVAYGFFPARAMEPEVAARLIHSADERVPVEDLELGVDFLRHVAQAICG